MRTSRVGLSGQAGGGWSGLKREGVPPFPPDAIVSDHPSPYFYQNIGSCLPLWHNRLVSCDCGCWTLHDGRLIKIFKEE